MFVSLVGFKSNRELNKIRGLSNKMVNLSFLSDMLYLPVILNYLNEKTHQLIISNRRRLWTPAAPEEWQVRCRLFADLKIKGLRDLIGEGRIWAFGNFTHTAKYNASNYWFMSVFWETVVTCFFPAEVCWGCHEWWSRSLSYVGRSTSSSGIENPPWGREWQMAKTLVLATGLCEGS